MRPALRVWPARETPGGVDREERLARVRPALFPADDRLLAAILGVVGAAVVWISTGRYGPGLTPDSVGYVSAARNVAAGHGLVLYNGSAYIDWPPLYPLLLAALARTTGADPIAVARALHAVLFALVIGGTWALLARDLRVRRPLALIGAAAVLTAPPLLKASVMAWSEVLFIALVVAFLLVAGSWRRRPRTPALVGMSVLAALGCLTRYAGIAFLLTGGFVILVTRRRHWRQAVFDSLVFGAVASYPLALWLARNLTLSGFAFGPRAPSDAGLGEIATLLFSTIAVWFFPEPPSPILILGAAGLSMLLAIAARAAPREETD
ncbi:MAG: hypothetical protein ACREQY_15770, partial [Candidatus Binatia bacterium]